jgi:hypothetical protein
MKWIYKLERKYGRYAIENLMKYIVILNAISFVILVLMRMPWLKDALVLSPSSVLRGEIWRLVTFVFLPPTTSIIWIAISLYFYYMIGQMLESYWGSFRLNLYYLLGIIGTIIGAFIIWNWGYSFHGVDGTYINLSLFLALAKIYPDFELRIYFLIPVKIKYLGYIYWAYLIFSLIGLGWPFRVAAIASLINYFIFFGFSFTKDIKNIKRTHKRKKQFNNFKVIKPEEFTYHKCTVCGITEKDNPDMDFRYCSSCQGDYEYCMDHLKNHEHIQKH